MFWGIILRSPHSEKEKKITNFWSSENSKRQERREFIRTLARMRSHAYLSTSDPAGLFAMYLGGTTSAFTFSVFLVERGLDFVTMCFPPSALQVALGLQGALAVQL